MNVLLIRLRNVEQKQIIVDLFKEKTLPLYYIGNNTLYIDTLKGKVKTDTVFMKLKELIVRNFRGFDEKIFQFDPELNIILGDNTTGKTTLLHAAQIALGTYFQAMTLVPGGKAYRRNFQDKDHVRYYSEANKDFLRISEKPTISVVADFYDNRYRMSNMVCQTEIKQIQWYRRSNTISRQSAFELIDVVRDMEKCRYTVDETGINAVFPLMLSFGANRLEKNYKGAKKTKARESDIEKAYKCALEEQVDFQSAFDWIYRYDKSKDKGNEFVGTDIAFIEAIKTAIPAIKQVDIDTKNNEFSAQIQMARDEHPRWLTYDMMSDGFKAMINVVAEIAYRCIKLNGFLGVESVNKTPGMVMIDELDLYLHPHWQKHVLKDLRTAFPQFQFIVTTHSPFIVQSVESKNIITLDGKKGDNDPNKRSLEEIVISEMNMDTVRSAKYNEMLEKAERYFQLVKVGGENTPEGIEAQKELDDIEYQFSDDPAYVALLKAERSSR